MSGGIARDDPARRPEENEERGRRTAEDDVRGGGSEGSRGNVGRIAFDDENTGNCATVRLCEMISSKFILG
jgi:hypothetical protein